MKLFASLLCLVANLAQASWIDTDNKSHRIEWTYLEDQSRLGHEAEGLYTNFTARSLDGRNFSHLQAKYKPKHRDVGIGFTTAVFFDGQTALLLDTIVHSGQPSEKLVVEPSLKLGVTLNHMLVSKEEEAIMVSLSAATVIGGRMKEKACLDELNRQFNCRAAMSVIDAPLIKKEPMNKNEFHIQLIWKRDFL